MKPEISFGDFLAAHRKRCGFSMREMGEFMGKTATYYFDLEKGKKKAPSSLELLDRLAEAFSLSKDERELMYDLAGHSRGEVPPDLVEFVTRPKVAASLRLCQRSGLTREEMQELVRIFENERVNKENGGTE